MILVSQNTEIFDKELIYNFFDDLQPQVFASSHENEKKMKSNFLSRANYMSIKLCIWISQFRDLCLKASTARENLVKDNFFLVKRMKQLSHPPICQELKNAGISKLLENEAIPSFQF